MDSTAELEKHLLASRQLGAHPLVVEVAVPWLGQPRMDGGFQGNPDEPTQ
jgi:hypothetical protein